jgi:hypothetical protein
LSPLDLLRDMHHDVTFCSCKEYVRLGKPALKLPYIRFQFMEAARRSKEAAEEYRAGVGKTAELDVDVDRSEALSLVHI